MESSTYKILGHHCSCPFSQSLIDSYKPTICSYWVYFRPMAGSFYDDRLQDFSCLINSLKGLYLVNKYIHPTENEWLIDFCNVNVSYILLLLAQNLRCTLKVVDIYRQKLIFERSPHSTEIIDSFIKDIDYIF